MVDAETVVSVMPLPIIAMLSMTCTFARRVRLSAELCADLC